MVKKYNGEVISQKNIASINKIFEFKSTVRNEVTEKGNEFWETILEIFSLRDLDHRSIDSNKLAQMDWMDKNYLCIRWVRSRSWEN